METSYDGPVEVLELGFHGRDVRLVQPANPDQLLEDPEVQRWNRSVDYMPYWAYLWPGAFLLAEAVAEEPWPAGLEAIELGCGLGLAGLVGLASGLRVKFTDYDRAPLRFVTRSAIANGFPATDYATELLDWTEPGDRSAPVILGADVLYERRLVPLVVGVLRRVLTGDGWALIAGPYRVATEDLEPCLASANLRWDALPRTARDQHGRIVRGTLHRIWKAR